VLGDNGHPESGIPYLEKARELDPLSPIILVDLATAYDQAGRWQDAERLFREVLELEPDFAPAYAGLYLHAQGSGDAEAAVTALQRFRELTPGNERSGMALWMGITHYMAGDLTSALEELRTGLSDPEAGDRMGLRRGLVVPSALYALRREEGPDSVRVYAEQLRSAIGPADSLYDAWLQGYERALAGDLEASQRALDRIRGSEETPDWMIWTLIAAGGDADDFFQYAQANLTADRETLSWTDRFFLQHEPLFDRFRGDPRFDELLDLVPPYPDPAARD
jgi:tetratricopeptide (TPR) repeat protein